MENTLFGAVKLTKNADIGKYRCSGYGIGCYRHGFYSNSSDGTGKNIITFDVDMSSPKRIDNKKKKHFNSSARVYTRIRTAFIICWKNLLDQFY